MNLSERRAELINQINAISDERTLEMLSETLAFYTHNEGRDITDDLDEAQLNELRDRMNEPADKDTISEEEFKKIFFQVEYKIVFKKRYLNDLLKVLEYLEQEWNKNVAVEFLLKLNNAADILRFHPHIGAPSSKVPNARALIITKHNRLYYRIEKDKIVFIFLADTRRKNYKH